MSFSSSLRQCSHGDCEIRRLGIVAWGLRPDAVPGVARLA